MSYKFDSLVIILNKLDNKAKVTAESLTEDLEVCKRTVHRYISTLQTAGFPIDYDHNNKTYAFTGGYTLRKPNLSLEETLAFCLGACRRNILKIVTNSPHFVYPTVHGI